LLPFFFFLKHGVVASLKMLLVLYYLVQTLSVKCMLKSLSVRK